MQTIDRGSYRSPYNRGKLHFQNVRLRASKDLYPMFEYAVNELLNYFAMPIACWRLMQVISPIHVDENLRVLDKNTLHVTISEVRKALKNSPYEIKSYRRSKGVWGYSIRYRQAWLERSGPPIELEVA